MVDVVVAHRAQPRPRRRPRRRARSSSGRRRTDPRWSFSPAASARPNTSAATSSVSCSRNTAPTVGRARPGRGRTRPRAGLCAAPGAQNQRRDRSAPSSLQAAEPPPGSRAGGPEPPSRRGAAAAATAGGTGRAGPIRLESPLTGNPDIRAHRKLTPYRVGSCGARQRSGLARRGCPARPGRRRVRSRRPSSRERNRIDAANPMLNAVVVPLPDVGRALAADPALPRGPFHGVPFLLKDAGACLAGLPLYWATRVLRWSLDWRAPAERVWAPASAPASSPSARRRCPSSAASRPPSRSPSAPA